MLTHRRFGSRREDRFRQTAGIVQAFRQRHATHRLAGLVFLPTTASQITTHHRLYRDRLQTLDQHGASGDLLHFICAHNRLRRIPRQMVRANMSEFFKPEQSHLREQHTLAWNRLTHDDVERADAVRRHHQDAVVTDRIVVAHLATRQERQRSE